MNYLDLILGIPILWFAFKGFKKGLIIEAASLLALVLGVYGALEFSIYVKNYLVASTEISESYLPLVSFAITFIAIVVAIHFIAKLLDKLVKAVALGFINRILGIAFAIIKITLILSVILMLVGKVDDKMQIVSPELKENSLLYEPVKSIVPMVFPMLESLNFNDVPNPMPDMDNAAESESVIV